MTMPPKNFKTIALIMAAGRGQRVGGALPKQYLHIKGRSILSQAISAFLNHPDVDAVRVVIGVNDEGFYTQAISSFNGLKLLPPIVGGAERSVSVRLGLESLEDFLPDNVLIHDGARPFVSQELISKVVQTLKHHKGVIPGVAVVDTLKRAPQKAIEATIDRRDIYQAQTPQGFDYSTILAAHQKLQHVPNLTDDASLLEYLAIPVQIVEGETKNRKITTSEDIEGEAMSVPDIRVGHGIDVHAIGSGEGVLILGIFIPVNFSLIGHSDADVGLHSLTDALLGAIGDGDIGQHFNPKDDRWKGADSSLFLQEAARRVREKGGEISHVDVTILGERPKIMPYRDQMIVKVAEILGIETSRISVKATTTEKLGFVGREEGLAAFATATVVFC
jgi:2-C-methyl-D-erythritol 4-phosphate cytidylyltransferase / 2-C-methyl-D-erythritol 2,4-cyclodiphosphate synthase